MLTVVHIKMHSRCSGSRNGYELLVPERINVVSAGRLGRREDEQVNQKTVNYQTSQNNNLPESSTSFQHFKRYNNRVKNINNRM